MVTQRVFTVDDMPQQKRAARSFACDCAERLMAYFSCEEPKDPIRDAANITFMLGGRDIRVRARDVANETMYWASNKEIERAWIAQRLYEYRSGRI